MTLKLVHTQTMTQIKCPKCAAVAKEVVYTEKHLRRGWYCGRCNTYVKAIGRERIVR